MNVTNKYALYNFLSTFSGTHYVTPRALTAEVGFHFLEATILSRPLESGSRPLLSRLRKVKGGCAW